MAALISASFAASAALLRCGGGSDHRRQVGRRRSLQLEELDALEALACGESIGSLRSPATATGRHWGSSRRQRARKAAGEREVSPTEIV
jgi:hypothetical protein